MTKKDIVVRTASETGLLQVQTQDIVLKFFDYIAGALANGETLEFRNFGVFELRVAKERKGRNPNKPENEMIIPEHVVAKFRPGKKLKERVLKIKSKDVK